VWKWPVVKYKHIKIKPRICVLFILCSTWTVNENSLKQNIIVIKEIGAYVLLSCHLGWMNRRRFCLQKRGSQEHISLKLVNIWRCYKQKCDCHRPEVEGGSIFAPNPTQASPHKLLFHHLTQLIIHTRLLKISCWYVHSQRMWDRFYNMVTPSPIAERSAVMTVSVCVCVCVCVCVSASICLEIHVRSLPNFCACYLRPWLDPSLAASR